MSAPANPTKEGYVFIGWDAEIPTVMPAKDLTIMAKWVENSSYAAKTQINEQFDNQDIPQELREVGLDTVEKIDILLRKKVKELNSDVEDMALYDVILMYSVDGGNSWIAADETHFPADGKLLVELPIPEGTDPLTHDYRALHMFTSAAFGKTPGGTEQPEVSIVYNDQGVPMIRFYVTGLSPVMLFWTAKPVPAVPQTGDPSSLMGWLVLAGASGMGVKALRRKKK